MNECPRCGDYEMMVPEEINALSRTTREEWQDAIYVCSACGRDEAMQEFHKGVATSPTKWPVAKREYDYLVFG